MRRPRPAINIATKCAVAHRQLIASGRTFPRGVSELPLKKQLPILLAALFGDQEAQLDHDPSLINRDYVEEKWERYTTKGGRLHLRIVPIKDLSERYSPPANDSNYLIWRTKADHDTKTRTRGEHGQYSDLALRRKNKRIAHNRDPHRRKVKIAQRKRAWPKRKFGGRK